MIKYNVLHHDTLNIQYFVNEVRETVADLRMYCCCEIDGRMPTTYVRERRAMDARRAALVGAMKCRLVAAKMANPSYYDALSIKMKTVL